MKMRLEVKGLKELKRELDKLNQRASKSAMTSALRVVGRPMAEEMRHFAPVDDGKLEASIKVSTVLKPKTAKAYPEDRKLAAKIYIGSSSSLGHLVEFGTSPFINKGMYPNTINPGQSPNPFVRPAFDNNVEKALADLKPELNKIIIRRMSKRENLK